MHMHRNGLPSISRTAGIFLVLATLALSPVAAQQRTATTTKAVTAKAAGTASITVTDLSGALTPAGLAQRLVGDGVTVSNVSYTGADVAAGTFEGGQDVMGFDGGVVLSSGRADYVSGPNSADDITADNGQPGDTDLDALIGGDFTTIDAAVLSFDFVPESDHIAFQYVFASDEYNEFVNSRFNDVFGFFVNGENCATFGDPPVPVAINSINGGYPLGSQASNPELYHNNDLDDGGPFYDTEADGFTVTLVCEASVVPNVANRMKLAIADVADATRDSWVLLKGTSLSTAPTTTIALEPKESAQDTGLAQTLRATVRDELNLPVADVTVEFKVSSGPHEGMHGTATTDQNGQATFQYTGTTAGVDEVQAAYTDAQGIQQFSNVVTITWSEGGAQLTISPEVLHFNGVVVGQSKTLSLTVSNDSQTDHNVLAVGVSGDDPDAFFFASDPLGPLAPGASRVVDLTFAPARKGFHSASIDFTSEGGTLSIPASGTGLAPVLTVTPPAVDFGQALLGSGGSDGHVVIRNDGTLTLEVTDVTVGGTAAADFAVTSAGIPASLEPDASLQIDLHFDPRGPGARSAVLAIASNAGQASVPLDGVGAVPSVQIQTPGTPAPGNDLVIQIVVPDAYIPAVTEVRYRRAGAASYERVALQAGTPSDGTVVLSATIPSAAVTARGIQYYFYFSNGDATLTLPFEDAEQHPLYLAVPFQSMTPPLTFQPRQYSMVALPVALDDSSLEGVFESFYGAPDDTRWRLLRWNPSTEEYDEYPHDLVTPALPGRAFWLITNDGAVFDVGSGRSVPAEPLTIRLDPGWNQISTPFAFPVLWDDVVKSGNVEAPVAYDGSEPVFDQTVLQPWVGYFVLNVEATPVTLRVPPVAAAEAVTKTEPAPRSNPAVSYGIQLKAHLGRLHDTQNFVGFAATATDGYDALDFHDVPPVGSYVHLSVIENGEALAGSFRPTGLEGASWDLEITAAPDADGAGDGLVTVEMVPWGERPDGFDLFVQDVDAGRAVALDGNRFTVDLGEAGTRHVRLFAGTRAFAETQRGDIPLEPVDFALEQNYPNPFNPSTAIPYVLAERGHVVIAVYDVLGRRVRTLVDADEPAGRHVVRWDGRSGTGTELASGTYYYRIHAGDFTATRHLTLLR